jgi:hypothetical protein
MVSCFIKISTHNSEVIGMTEQKAKPATKKVTTAKAGSAVASKPKTIKAWIAATTKKPVVKKPAAKRTVAAVAEPKKTNAPAVKKAATPVAEKKAPATKAPATKAATTEVKPATNQKTVAKPTPEERYRMVETAAYFIAEQHGFQGRSDEHWAAAEREIAAKLNL